MLLDWIILEISPKNVVVFVVVRILDAPSGIPREFFLSGPKNVVVFVDVRILDAPSGIRTRVAALRGLHDWPDYTNGAFPIKYFLYWQCFLEFDVN